MSYINEEFDMKGRFAALLCGLFFAPLVSAQPTPTSATSTAPTLSEQWRFSVTPYAWAMGIRGSISHNGTSLGTVKLTSGDILSDIKMAAMLVAEARRGRFGLYLDGMYGDLGKSTSSVAGRDDLTSKTSITMSMLTLAPTYNMVSTPSLQLDGLVGARVMWQSASTRISFPQAGESVSESSNLQLAAGIVGVKGRYNFENSKYFVPFYVDVGAGQSSSFTSQAYLGVGHAFDWGDVSLVAKNVYYQFKPNQSNIDLNMFGAALAVTFRF
jgi:hypothetical protein